MLLSRIDIFVDLPILPRVVHQHLVITRRWKDIDMERVEDTTGTSKGNNKSKLSKAYRTCQGLTLRCYGRDEDGNKSSRGPYTRLERQPLFGEPIHHDVEPGYKALNDQAFDEVQEQLPRVLKETGPVSFGTLWPLILEHCHVTESGLAQLLFEMYKSGQIKVEGVLPRQRTVKDENILSI